MEQIEHFTMDIPAGCQWRFDMQNIWFPIDDFRKSQEASLKDQLRNTPFSRSGSLEFR
jgi:hypothetical protein